MKTFKSILLLILAGSGSIILLILIFFIRLRSVADRHDDPVRNHYNLFTKKLHKIGITKSPSLGPWDFAQNATSQRPDITAEINGITRLYTLIRYGGQQDDSQLFTDFRKMVKAFKPKVRTK